MRWRKYLCAPLPIVDSPVLFWTVLIVGEKLGHMPRNTHLEDRVP
jgi:hypothetical protein